MMRVPVRCLAKAEASKELIDIDPVAASIKYVALLPFVCVAGRSILKAFVRDTMDRFEKVTWAFGIARRVFRVFFVASPRVACGVCSLLNTEASLLGRRLWHCLRGAYLARVLT
jgi:hypothetical protein